MPAPKHAQIPGVRARPGSPHRRLIRLLPVLLPLAGCGTGVLDPQGPIGAANRLILLNALAIMLVIVVPTILMALAFAWWYRASNTRAVYRPDFTYSGRVEVLVWSCPILIIIFLGGVIWAGSHDLDPAEPIPAKTKPIEVQAVSLDWKWLFIYPDQGVASVNQLVVPTGVPVHFALTSSSVMNTFFVPQLGSMIYTMNRMVTQLNLQADHPGSYLGESGMFSGDGFSDMDFTVQAVSPDAFTGWVQATQQQGTALDAAAYGKLAQQSQNVKPFTFRSVEPNLFQAIVTQKLSPGPGPQEGRGGVEVHPRGGK